MLTEQILAMLAAGATLRADRTYPHPHHYTVALSPLAPEEITTDDVIALLATKRIDAPRAADIGDHYQYTVIDPVWARAAALMPFGFGFGRCPVCSAFPLGLTAKGLAPRHGHTKEHPEPCEGSGKPLVQVVSREPLKVAA